MYCYIYPRILSGLVLLSLPKPYIKCSTMSDTHVYLFVNNYYYLLANNNHNLRQLSISFRSNYCYRHKCFRMDFKDSMKQNVIQFKSFKCLHNIHFPISDHFLVKFNIRFIIITNKKSYHSIRHHDISIIQLLYKEYTIFEN